MPADVMVQKPPVCAAKFPPFKSNALAELLSDRLFLPEQSFDGVYSQNWSGVVLSGLQNGP